jgi:hypothetical protein
MSGRAPQVALLLLALASLAAGQTHAGCTGGVSVHNVCLGPTTMLVLKIAAGLQIVSRLVAACPFSWIDLSCSRRWAST